MMETRTIAIKATAGKYGHQGQWLTPGCGYILQKPLADFLVDGGFAGDSDDPNAVDMSHLTLAEGTVKHRDGVLRAASVVTQTA